MDPNRSTHSQPPELSSVTFKEAYCKHFRCPPEYYEKDIFRRAVYKHAVLVARIVQFFSPDFFREDFAVIRELGEVRNRVLFHYELNVFKGRIQRENRWLKRRCRIRVSGQRLRKLRYLLDADQPET